MKKKINFSTLLDNNKFVKILSVFLAIIAWFIVVTTINDDGTVSIRGVGISFDLAGTTPASYGLSLVEGGGQTVDIKVTGKKYIIGPLSNDDFIAVPAFTTVTKPGTYTLPIEIRSSSTDVISQDYVATSYTSNITVTFDYIVEKTFDLTAEAANIKPSEGFVIESVIANPDRIALKGPESEIDKISKAVLESHGNESVVDDSVTVDGVLVLYDEKGKILDLKHTVSSVTDYEISVQIYKYATVPTAVSFINVPNGLDISKLNYSFSEPEIEIAGPKDIIDKITSINIGDIDFRKINIYSIFDMQIELPAGVVNTSSLDYVAVIIESDELDTKTLTIDNFSIKNVPIDYDVKVTSQSISDVVLVGDIEDIAEISSSDLIAVVDLQGVDFSSGRNKVTAQIYCTGNKFVWAVGEYNVFVSASKKTTN